MMKTNEKMNFGTIEIIGLILLGIALLLSIVLSTISNSEFGLGILWDFMSSIGLLNFIIRDFSHLFLVVGLLLIYWKHKISKVLLSIGVVTSLAGISFTFLKLYNQINISLLILFITIAIHTILIKYNKFKSIIIIAAITRIILHVYLLLENNTSINSNMIDLVAVYAYYNLVSIICLLLIINMFSEYYIKQKIEMESQETITQRKSLNQSSIFALVIIVLTVILTVWFVNDPDIFSRGAVNKEELSVVMPGADSTEDLSDEYKEKGLIVGVYKAKNGNDEIGYIYRMMISGYKPDLETLVGIDNDGNIVAAKVTQSSETPGLGALVAEDAFISQFSNKETSFSFVVVKGKPESNDQISAVSGATISSSAVVNSINEAVNFHKKEILSVKVPEKKPIVVDSPETKTPTETPKQDLSSSKVYYWIQDRYEYYDIKYNDGEYSGDKYTTEVFSDAAAYFKTTVSEVRKAYDAFRY